MTPDSDSPAVALIRARQQARQQGQAVPAGPVAPRVEVAGPIPPTPARPARPGRPRGDDCRVVLRCTPAYKRWLEGLADHIGCSVTTAVTQGAARAAEIAGWSSPPRRYQPKRTGRHHPSEDGG